jgi:hypothetical protein
MTERLTSEMGRLPELVHPTSMATNVMARIARLPDERTRIPHVPDTPRTVTTPAQGERLAWTWILAGVAIVFGTYIYGGVAAWAPPDLTSFRIGTVQLTTLPGKDPVVLCLAAGLLLYLAGLFSPLRRER